MLPWAILQRGGGGRVATEKVARAQEMQCIITSIFYTGDMGGILCGLDIGGAEATTAHVVSITHLRFDRRVPLSREIEGYQRHRIKKLKQQRGRGY